MSGSAARHAPGAWRSCRSGGCRRPGRSDASLRGPRSRARTSSSRSRRRRRRRHRCGRARGSRPRSRPASPKPIDPDAGPRNVPGRRNRNPRASQPAMFPASDVRIAFSGRTACKVSIARPGCTPAPSQVPRPDIAREEPRLMVGGSAGRSSVAHLGVERSAPEQGQRRVDEPQRVRRRSPDPGPTGRHARSRGSRSTWIQR